MIIISNYAPDPEKEQVYVNLQNKTLADVTAEDIQRLTDPTFIQATNQDALLTYNTVNKAAMRDGNAMPDKGAMESQTQTTSDVPIVVRPPKGEVWKIQAIAATNNAVLGASQGYNFFISNEDDGSVPQTSTDLFYSSLSSTSTVVTAEALFDDNAIFPIEITNTMFLRFYANYVGTSAGHEVKWFYAYTQTR